MSAIAAVRLGDVEVSTVDPTLVRIVYKLIASGVSEDELAELATPTPPRWPPARP